MKEEIYNNNKRDNMFHSPIITNTHTQHTGIIGVGVGLCAAKLAVIAVGALFGLALTMGLLSIPEVSEAIRSHLPSWGLALIVIAVSIAVIFLLEDYVYIAVTALIGALAAAMGADLIMQTGFNQEAMRCLTSPHPPADFQVCCM